MGSVLECQSKCQRIRIVPDRMHDGEVKLYLDDLFQLSTFSEFKYHESLITIPMCAAPNVDRILIAGGGDGMSLREALQFQYCRPTMVELDKGMLDIWRDMPQYSKYNNNSMRDPRATVIVNDAIQYLANTQEKYDMIFWDFPGGDDLGNLYNPSSLHHTLQALERGGVFATHVSVPMSKLVKLVQELKQKAFNIWMYDAFYDIQGNHDSFLVASQRNLNPQRQVPVECKWVNHERVKIAFSDATELTKNRLNYFIQFLDMESIDDDDN